MPNRTVPTKSTGSDKLSVIGLTSTWVYALIPANFVPTIIGRLVSDFGVEALVAGGVATGMTFANASMVLLLRRYAEHGNRTLLARIGAAGMALPLLAGVLTLNPMIIMIGLVLSGLGAGTLIAASSAAVSATNNPDRATNTVMVMNRLVVAIAYFLIPAIGGGLITAMWILIIPAGFSLFASAWLPKAPVSKAVVSQSPESATPPPTSAIKTVPGGPNMTVLAWILAIAFGCWTLTDDGIYALVELLADENIAGIEADFVATVLGFSTLCGLLGALLAGFWRKLLGRGGALILVFGISLVAKALLTVGTTKLMLTLGLCLWDFSFGSIIPLVFGLAARAAVDGSVSILTNGVYVFGVALGPFFGTLLFNRGGGPLVSIVMTGIGIVTAILVVYIARVVEKNVEKVTPEEDLAEDDDPELSVRV